MPIEANQNNYKHKNKRQLQVKVADGFMEDMENDNGCSKNDRNRTEKHGRVLKYEDKMM